MILYSQWMRLPINVRHKIANDLGIPKKSPTHVQDNVIISDGYTIQDVEDALTVERLQIYLGVGLQETDIHILWDMLINPQTHEENVITNVAVIEVPKKHRGRMKGAKNKPRFQNEN